MSAAQKIGAIGITPEELEMAAGIASAMQRKLPRSVLREDLQQAALIGLWDAVRRSNGDSTPEQRKGYLVTRIRGQILDELRAQDWLPRRARKSGGSGAGATVIRFDDIGRADAGHSFEECLPCPGPSPEEQVIGRMDRERAASEALGAPLTERHLHIVRGHYFRGQRFVDLGTQLGTSEARISQLHSQAIHTMRGWLTGEDVAWAELAKDRPLVVAQKAVAAKWEKHEHRTDHRGAGEPASEDPPSRIVERRVRSRRLGRPAAAASDRPVPARARGAELGREARARVLAAPRGGPRDGAARSDASRAVAGASHDRGRRGGLAVTAAEVTTATAIPSTLPDAGIDLTVELERYREWMIGQALALAHGNEQRAADLLGLNRTTLVEMLARSTASARVESPSMAQPAPAAEPGVDAKTAEVPTRIPWDLVASMRAEGSNDGIIARRVRSIIGGNYWAIEKALKQPRPIAKCGP